MRIGIGMGIGYTEGRFGQVISAKALVLKFDALSNAPVADPASVSDWNTFFDLPANGTVFSSVIAQGRHVYLYGGGNITLANALFYENTNIISIIDTSSVIEFADNEAMAFCDNLSRVSFPILSSCGAGAFSDNPIIQEYSLPSLTDAGAGCFSTNEAVNVLTLPLLFSVGDSCFSACESVQDFIFPELVAIGTLAFDNCLSMATCYIPSCTTMGSSVTDDTVFNAIDGNTITLTVPAALMTADGGNPHASIAALQLNNDVTVIEV